MTTPLTLALPKGRLLDPALALLAGMGIRGFDRQSLALHQLDDMTVLQIDRGDEHVQSLTGIPCARRWRFKSVTLDSA